MTLIPRPQRTTFRDAKNQTATFGYYKVYDSTIVSDNAYRADVAETNVAWAALSNAAVQSVTGDQKSAPLPVQTGASGVQYEDVEDKVVFVFQTATGEIHRYQIPAPKSAIFQADGETVDFTNSLVKLAIADALAATFGGTAPDADVSKPFCSRGGAAITVSVGGYRTRKKAIRRFNVFTRNPALTGQGL